MPFDRGGRILKTGLIGKMEVLKQQILLPGETADLTFNGQIKLETLRERQTFPVDAEMFVFMTPIRWLWSGFPEYVTSRGTVGTPPTTVESDWAKFGMGSVYTGGMPLLDWYRLAPLRIYNEWFKWPESADITDLDDAKCVPLADSMSRLRESDGIDADAEIDVSGGTLDVRDLAQQQGIFMKMLDAEMSAGRYQEYLSEAYNSDGSREVDQVPMLIDSTNLDVRPKEMPATDGASLGSFQTMYDFGVQHRVASVVAPEHCVVTCVIVLRFQTSYEGVNPLGSGLFDYANVVGDMDLLSQQPMEEVKRRDLTMINSASVLGYLPSGWRWRSRSDVIGQKIDYADSFPMLQTPSTFDETKDAMRITEAFRSARLGHYTVTMDHNHWSDYPLVGGEASLNLGRTRGGGEFPRTGKVN